MFILIWLLYAVYVFIALATPTPVLQLALAGNWLITPNMVRAFVIVVGFLVCVALSLVAQMRAATR